MRLTGGVDLLHHVTGAVVVFVEIGEEVENGNAARIEGAVIAGSKTVAESGDAEGELPGRARTGGGGVRAVDERWQF